MDAIQTSSDNIKRLFDRINYERQPRVASGEFKLTNMVRLLERLGDPQLDCPVVHVAGTKGKGSVCAFIGSILRESGLKTGIYSSPHLERVNQRISLDGSEITNEQLEQILKKLEPTIVDMDRISDDRESKKLTFFEVITASAFQFFADQSADAVILEVGMGGRLDSTNVCQPEICVITNISLDHTRQLGSTVDKIAAEKAGIIKQGIPVISGVVDPNAAAVIQQFAREHASELIQSQSEFRSSESSNQNSCFDYRSQFNSRETMIKNLRCGMRGTHQHENAAIAIAVCQQLIRNGWQIREENIRNGIQAAALPGRCEIVPGPPLIVLDMAHNEASTSALAETLTSDMPEFAACCRKTLLFAASREKDVAAMLKPLLPLFDQIIISKYQDNPRGRPAIEVFEIAQAVVDGGMQLDGNMSSNRIELELTIASEPVQAIEQFVEKAGPNDALCITGSAFLVAEVRPMVVNSADDIEKH